MGSRNYNKTKSKSSTQESYFDQAISYVRRAAVAQKLITKPQLELYLNGLDHAKEHIMRRKTGRGDKNEFQRRITALNLISDGDILAIAKLAAIESLLSHAYRNAEIAANEIPLKQKFRNVLENNNKAEIQDVLKDLIISYTHTMHPTIHETPYATEFLTEITTILEVKGRHANIEKLISNFIKGVVAGSDITPTKQITVEEETRVEEENLYKINREIDNIVEYWNEAVEEFAFEHNDDEVRNLTLSAEERKRIFEERSWGKGGADADGRPKSTSLLLNRAINDSVIDGKYTGPKLDLRQNAKIHTDLVSSLVQRKFRTSNKFADLCYRYNESSKGAYLANKTIYSLLPEYNMAEFLKEIITSCDEVLIAPEVLEYIRDFNLKFYPAFKKFQQSQRLDPDISFSQLVNTEAKGFYPGTTLANVLSEEMHKLGFELEDSGSYQPADRTFPYRNYLARTWRYNERKIYTLTGYNGEREEMMETVKRLTVINAMIEKYGSIICDRYQIANFAGAHNFYEMLLLFKETGIATFKDGRMISTKLGIQPLLETLEDMQKAPQMFAEMLKDPLVLGYYKTRGMAEFMLGFSDGAKSAGNFASEWQIYKVAEDLQKLFAGYGINTRFFEGRGRGVSRGGLLDMPEIARYLMPPAVVKSAVFDHTIQSDQPHEAAIDPAFGERYFASAFTGTLLSAMQVRDSEKKIKSADKKILNFIAEKSAHYFQSHIRHNPNADKFLAAIYLNPDIASRSAERGKLKTYEKTRAIPIELKQTFAELPFHYAGFKTGLLEYINNENFGTPEENFVSLQKLSGENAFFKYFLIRTLAGLKHYHADVAESYGEKAGEDASRFVVGVVNELNGLEALVQVIKDGDKLKNPEPGFAEIIDTYAHMMMSVATARGAPPAEGKLPAYIEAARLFMTIMVTDSNNYAAARPLE